MICKNLSSEGGCVACRIRHMCCVSSRDTSRRSPTIMSSSNWAFAPGDNSNTGGSKLRGTKGLFRGCFLGVLEPFPKDIMKQSKEVKMVYKCLQSKCLEISLFPLYILVLKIGFLYIFCFRENNNKPAIPFLKERHYVAWRDLKKIPLFQAPK